MDLRTPLFRHALSKATIGNQGILVTLNFADSLPKARFITPIIHHPSCFAIAYYEILFFQTAITIFSVQTPDPKAKAT